MEVLLSIIMKNLWIYLPKWLKQTHAFTHKKFLRITKHKSSWIFLVKEVYYFC